jgi:acyl-coenzyme A thioesterase PaaI-like protein
VIHFAVLTTVAEIAAAAAVGAPVVPATVTVHLLSRARLAPLVGKGKVLRKGKRPAVAEGEVTQNGELVTASWPWSYVQAPAELRPPLYSEPSGHGT